MTGTPRWGLHWCQARRRSPVSPGEGTHCTLRGALAGSRWVSPRPAGSRMNEMPREDKDHLSNEVSVNAQLTDTGISARTRSRAVSAFDRLGGAVLDIPAAMLENTANRIRNKGRIVTALQGTAIQRIEENEDLRPAIDAILASGIDSLVNKKHVIERAVAHLYSGDQDDKLSADEVDADWLNNFAGYAEKASSKKVRDLWGRVLAGEIRRHGAFSLSTLRLLAELDQTLASSFEQEVQHRFAGEYIFRGAGNELAGEQLTRILLLEEVGLLQHASPIGGVQRSYAVNDENTALLSEGHLCIVLVSGNNQPIKCPVIPLTRAGREIATILPPVEPMEVLRRLGETVKDRVIEIRIHRLLQRVGDEFFMVQDPLEVMKRA